MLFEIEFLQRRAIVIDTFDLTCAEALVQKWVEDKNRERKGDVTVVCITPVKEPVGQAA